MLENNISRGPLAYTIVIAVAGVVLYLLLACLLFMLHWPSFLMPALVIVGFIFARDVWLTGHEQPVRRFSRFQIFGVILGTLCILYAEFLFQVHCPGFIYRWMKGTECYKQMLSGSALPSCFIPLYIGIVGSLIFLALGLLVPSSRSEVRGVGRAAGVSFVALVIICPLNSVSVVLALAFVFASGLLWDDYRKSMLPKD